MRHILDPDGRTWHAVTVPIRGAHLRAGALLAFRPADTPSAEPLPTTIKFNSDAAAARAIGQMGEHELLRRLELARAGAGVG